MLKSALLRPIRTIMVNRRVSRIAIREVGGVNKLRVFDIAEKMYTSELAVFDEADLPQVSVKMDFFSKRWE